MGALVAVNLFPNCFEKAKAGRHFLFFGQIALTFIKRTNVALAHNDAFTNVLNREINNMDRVNIKPNTEKRYGIKIIQ